MQDILKTIYNMRFLDDAARKNTALHRIHPLMKVIATLVFLVIVVSFGRYEIGRLLPFLFYPVFVFVMAEIPVIPLLKRILFIEPLIIGIGILNPLFDKSVVVLGGLSISGGWVTFLSIIIKSFLTIVAALLLIATTGMDNLAYALRVIRVPRIFVLQLLLTYRYITVLMEEVSRITRAYSLRAPGQKGIHMSAWGSLAGQLILRTYDRGQRVYQAMCLRGFNGEYYTGAEKQVRMTDILFLAAWCIFFVIARLYDLPELLGLLVTGAVK